MMTVTKKKYDFEIPNFSELMQKIKDEYEKQKCKELGITFQEFRATCFAHIRNQLYADKKLKDIQFGHDLEEKKEIPKECLEILEDPKLFDRITVTELDKRVVGEIPTRQSVFLVANMRNVENLNEATDNLLLNAESRSGKDYIIKSVMEILPSTERVEKRRITPKVLAYLNNRLKDPLATWDKKVLALEDTPNAVLNDDSFKVICSARGITRETVMINQIPTEIEIDGKPPIILSSATANPKAEILGRFPICKLDETEEQTKAIIKRQLEYAEKGETIEYDPKIIESQKYLKRIKIKIPFADKLFGVISTKHVVMRTHNQRFLDYIKSSCSLHQYQRKQDSEGYYLAEGRDYDIARIVLLKTMTNPFMISLTTDFEKILEVFRKLPTTEVIISEETGKEKEVKIYYSLKELEPHINFASDQMLRKQLQKLTEWGFLETDRQEKESVKQKVQVWSILELSEKTIPTWKGISKNDIKVKNDIKDKSVIIDKNDKKAIIDKKDTNNYNNYSLFTDFLANNSNQHRFIMADEPNNPCYVCGDSPAQWFDNNNGKHLCDVCKNSLEINK